MDYKEKFSQKNLGMPIKCKRGYRADNPKEPVYQYGRFYGTGYDGESKPGDDDFTAYITMVTPHGSMISGNSMFFEDITSEYDKECLKNLEDMVEEPYRPYMFGLDGEYVKTYDYLKEPITEGSYNQKWYEKNGYLDIDIDVFGEGLSLVFMYNFDYPCYYSKVYYKYEGKTRPFINYNDTSDSRYFYVVSPNKYPKSITRQFGDGEHPYRKRDDNDTMFKQKPIRFIDEAFLLRFTQRYREKETIHLGDIVNGKFVPAIIVPFTSYSEASEAEYEHFEHSFIQEFMARIFKYKLDHRKPNIDMEDMYNILETYGFSRKHEIERLARVLKRAEEKAEYELKASTSVGRVLKKEEK